MKDAYGHEMDREQHLALLETISSIEGRFMLSGYRSDLYDHFTRYHDWHRTDWEIDNKSGGGKVKQKRVECLWRNFS